jgi:hypothetical protein
MILAVFVAVLIVGVLLAAFVALAALFLFESAIVLGGALLLRPPRPLHRACPHGRIRAQDRQRRRSRPPARSCKRLNPHRLDAPSDVLAPKRLHQSCRNST